MSTRRTGLGLGSLLLHRTTEQEVPPVPKAHAISQPQAPEAYPETAVPQGRALNQRGINRARQLRDRCTLYLEPGVNQQLDLVARIERRQRSEVVTDILRRYLPKYRISEE